MEYPITRKLFSLPPLAAGRQRKNPIILEKIRLITQKPDYLAKSPIILEKSDYW
jgi:hypothetical protein